MIRHIEPACNFLSPSSQPRRPFEERIPCLRRDGEVECCCQRSHVRPDEIVSLDIVFGEIDRWQPTSGTIQNNR